MPELSALERHDRQVRAFGPAAQQRLRQLTVGVVGAGGAGSLLVQGLAHLGVGRLIIVDPDHVVASNLNRLVGARPAHANVGLSKAAVAARHVRDIDDSIAVHPVCGDVLDPPVWQLLRCADILLGAVDAHAPRWALNHLAVQYARCYIDVGVNIGAAQSGALEVAGHVATVTPDGPCLLCLSGYDPRRAAGELDPELTATKRSAGYLADAPDQPTPSVIFLNQAVTALALAEVVNQVSGWRTTPQYVLVDLSTSTFTVLAGQRSPDCAACGIGSARGLGDAGGIPVTTVRPDPPTGDTGHDPDQSTR